ncbi:hypothetical protein LX32DRAFT_220546 [Colletotrichum zoysiae]|uniref:Uncharacterized protein n=1 Tax=Colletotrichum zoysiae TaxID=1216348 RepID=A0AAD9HNF3_9PEZI|nr:hypothetical protein LX32DRAFT_220546 [Colletotrichum zoysiae]
MQCGRTTCQLKGGRGKRETGRDRQRQAEREREREKGHPSIHSSFLPRFTSLQSMCAFLSSRLPNTTIHSHTLHSHTHSHTHSLSFSLSPTRTKKENPPPPGRTPSSHALRDTTLNSTKRRHHHWTSHCCSHLFDFLLFPVCC